MSGGDSPLPPPSPSSLAGIVIGVVDGGVGLFVFVIGL